MPAITPPLRLNAQGTQVQTVQANLAKVGLTVPATESTGSVLGAGTSTAVKQFQIANKLPVTGTVDMATQSALTNAATAAAANQSTVSGQMLMDYGAPANAITARLYSIGFAAAATKLAETKTDANGMYSLAYAAPTTAINIEVRVVNPQNTEVTVSSVVYNVRPNEVLNLVVPASVQPQTDEFDRLSADLQTAIGGVANLTKAQETPTQQDLTLLNRTTGWDARLLAIATTATQQAATTGLGTDMLYALFRCGLPTDPQALALVPSATIGAALQKASQAGIVTMTAAQITTAQTAFTTYAAKANLAIKVPGSLSAVSDLLGTTFTDANLQSTFMNLVFDPTVQGADLWNKAAAAGIPPATIDTLKLQGKLSLLTFNNAKLSSQLQTQLGSLANLSQLADQDYHLDTTWTILLNTLSGNNAQTLQTLIPPLYGGTAPAEAYAADLARKVRVSFPTRVIARMVENNSLPLPVAAPAPPTSAAGTAPVSTAPASLTGTAASPTPPTVAQGVTTFLRSAEAVGFKLGVTPLNSFLKNPPKGVTVPTDSSTVKWIKNLHRLYQITPSNESLVAAVKLGFTSARDVAALSEDRFLSTYGSSFPTDEAKLVYRKAKQVNSAMVHVFSTAKLLDTLPPMYVLNPSPTAVQSAKNVIIEQYPTMATLFGAQDYCECDDCRSILSPAAYLVSLFQFIDDGPIWQAFLTNWQAMYKQTYPNPSQTPFSVLTSRRPDLPNLNLSCENTNTALPYIDVVNEILEYYAVNSNLSQLNYDTGSAASANLIAEPQNVLQAAYIILSNQNSAKPAVYPLGLPFDLWIETVRGFLGYFNIKLAQVLEIFRPADNLELFTDANAYSYYRASIFAEALGIAPCENALFTSANALQNWYEYYGYPSATASTTAVAALGGSAKTLANNLDVSYQDLANLVDTGFLNPKLAPLIGPLQANGLSLNDVFAYTKQPGFTSNATIPVPLQPWLNSILISGYSNTVLILQAPSANTCDFQDTKFLYAGGTMADTLSFLKLNFFVRLWNKLGWTIDEVDQALQVFLLPFIPASSDATFGADFSAAMKTALVYLSHLEELFTKLQPGPYGRIGILPLWGNIPTTGSNPLYAQIFLTPAVVNSDPVFNDPAGQYLCYYDPTSKTYLPFQWNASQTQENQTTGFVLLSNHTTALQGALGLTANDITAILNDNNLPLNTTPLTMANVSLLYRYAFLSQALQLSISDFIGLKQMSGLSPFAPLKAPLGVLADDAVWNQTLKFVEIAAKVQASGFTISQLQYLLSQYDPGAQYSPDPDTQMQQLMAAATAIQAIQTQNAVPTDPTAFTDDLIRQKMAQVFPAATAQTFMGMWSGTVQYTATTPAAAAIPSTILPQELQIQLSYDPVAQAQSLVYQGVLVDSAMTRITGEITALVTAGTLTAAQQTLLQGLLSNVQGQAQAFFQKYLQVASGPLPYGFLPASDFDLLFTPPPPPATNTAARQELANKFLPYLQQSLISQYLVRTTASALGASTGLTTDFLTNTALLADPTQPGASLMSALQAAALSGLSVTYYSDPAEQTKLTSGVPAIVASADTSLTDTTQNPPVPKATGFNSAHFEGYLVVPSDGLYRFTAVLPNATATANLQFDFMSSPLIYGLGTGAGTPLTYTASNDTQFKAGIPYHFIFDVQSLGGGQASLLVQGESLPQGPLSQLTLYPETAAQRFNQANVLLSNAFQLISGFNLDETEVLYFTANAADFDNVSFSALPTVLKNSFTPNPTLFGQFLRLANYASLRQGPAGGTDGLIDLFQEARQTFPASAANPGNQTLTNFCQSADALTNRATGTALATVNQLWLTGLTNSSTVGTGAQAQVKITLTPLVNDVGFRRLWEALQLVQTLGVPPTVLGSITGIVYPRRAASSAPPPVNDPGQIIAAQLENALKSFYGSQPQTWLAIAQSIFDPLRQKKRDALCAYVMSLLGVSDTNGLFEYFLVDPGMEPVVQTSRIELAMSSVQTFIQRCLLNLETKVHPSAIDADQWSWMKRYRVWDANREIFLWPENWLIPEFRENATDLFQAMEGTLLQGNITEDLVETAFNQYLQDLDTRARLDIVTMYNEPPTTEADYNTYHVIGRNHGKPPKYFYRTYANGVWAGWIPVTADIEGDHIAAVVWRGRLTVFWLTFAIQAPPNLPPTQGIDSNDTNVQTAVNMSVADIVAQASRQAPPTTVQIKLNWSEYFQGQWSPRKSSDINRFAPLTVDTGFDPASDVYIHVYIDAGTSADANSPDPVETVLIQLDSPNTMEYPIDGAFRLTSKNAEPTFGQSYQYWQQAWSPYNSNPTDYPVYYYDASKYVGYDSVSGNPSTSTLYVNLPAGWVNNADGSSTQLSAVNETILQDVGSFTILTCDDMMPVTETRKRDVSRDTRSFINYYYQVGALTSPFFYQDTSDVGNSKELAFFVQPSLVQQLIPNWGGWVMSHPLNAYGNSGALLSGVKVQSQVPNLGAVSLPDRESLYAIQPSTDWVTKATTLLPFQSGLVANKGGTVLAANVTNNLKSALIK